eukprot:3273574-Prorocentrum_lima.AAC.1
MGAATTCEGLTLRHINPICSELESNLLQSRARLLTSLAPRSPLATNMQWKEQLARRHHTQSIFF